MHTIRSKAHRAAWRVEDNGTNKFNPFARTAASHASKARLHPGDSSVPRHSVQNSDDAPLAAQPNHSENCLVSDMESARIASGQGAAEEFPQQHQAATMPLGSADVGASSASPDHDTKEYADTPIAPIQSSTPSTGPRKRVRNPFKSSKRENDDPELQRTNTMESAERNKIEFTLWGQVKTILLGSWINLLLVAVPAGFACEYAHVEPVATFVVNFAAIVPLAGILAYATEEIALRVGETLGGLLNATFGNAVELIVSIIALVDGEIIIVQSSLIGSMLSNLLLVLGLSFFLGGINREEQNFNVVVAQTSASLLALCIGSLIVPTAFHLGSAPPGTEQNFDGVAEISRGSSIVMLLVYASYLIFQLKSHREIYNKPSEKTPKRSDMKRVETGEVSKGIARMGIGPGAAVAGSQYVDQSKVSVSGDDEDEQETPQISVWAAIITLVAATVLVAFCAEFLVGSVDAVTSGSGISRTFLGLILLPIVGNAAEHATAVTVAIKDKMDLSIGVAVGSSMQIALLVLPFTVILGWIIGEDRMTLYFDGFQIGVLFVAVLLVNYLIQDGKSHWLEGVLLVAMYIIIAIAAYFYPTIENTAVGGSTE